MKRKVSKNSWDLDEKIEKKKKKIKKLKEKTFNGN